MGSIRKIFLSYSHADEWLKDELLKHLSPLRESNGVYVWHDRCLVPGMNIDSEIDNEIRSCDFAILLVSADFISSRYCMTVEYRIAQEREQLGELTIIPIIIRSCDWKNFGIDNYSALPTDGKAVADETMQRSDVHKRDSAWLQVALGVKAALSVRNRSESKPIISNEYVHSFEIIDYVRHPTAEQIDETDLLVDPELYDHSTQTFVTTFNRLIELVYSAQATIIVGGERSGKTLISKQLFKRANLEFERPLLIKGGDIKNLRIAELIRNQMKFQYSNSDNWIGDVTVIIDDFEECSLGDKQKSDILKVIHDLCKRCVVISISSAPSLIYTSPLFPDPLELTINELTEPKLMKLVDNWVGLSGNRDTANHDRTSADRYDLISRVFSDTSLPRRPYTAITFLELAETTNASDIQITSFASCYDALVTHRLLKNSVPPQQIDESKNFISFLAYQLFEEGNGSPIGSITHLDHAVSAFENEFLSDSKWLKEKIAPLFIKVENDCIGFREPYLWYFMTARHIAGPIRRKQSDIYLHQVAKAAENVHKKIFANILIYLAYFSNDESILEYLCIQTEEFFAKASRWEISDDRRSLMLNLAQKDGHSYVDDEGRRVVERRMEAARTNVVDILEKADDAVSKYTTPGLGYHGDRHQIEKVPDGSELRVSRDSYQQHVNALIRLHSVIGHILQARSGTYTASRVVETIDSMIRASGRYADLNQSMAMLIQHDDPEATEEVARVEIANLSSIEEKKKKLVKLFGFWSVYMSQAGLAKYLTSEHTVRALRRLAMEKEIDAENPQKAFNFSSCYVVASLLSKNCLDEEFLDKAIEKFGDTSALMAFVRAAVYHQSHYLTLNHKDRQRIEHKLSFASNRLLQAR